MVSPWLLAALGNWSSRMLKKVQMRGGARRPHAKRSLSTLSVRPRAPYLRRWAFFSILLGPDDLVANDKRGETLFHLLLQMLPGARSHAPDRDRREVAVGGMSRDLHRDLHTPGRKGRQSLGNPPPCRGRSPV